MNKEFISNIVTIINNYVYIFKNFKKYTNLEPLISKNEKNSFLSNNE